MENKLRVLIIMGSQSDWPVVKKAADQLEVLGIAYEKIVSSAHRTPENTAKLAKEARSNGFGVIIAAAGMAAHLAGAIAAWTTLPVIGLPLKSKQLEGVDALLSTVMMPPGIPVATVGIDGAQNAAILAAEILAVNDLELTQKLQALRNEAASKIINSKLD